MSGPGGGRPEDRRSGDGDAGQFRADELARLDQTLDEPMEVDSSGDGDELPGSGALRTALIRQRLVHSLLTMVASARDVAARDRRVHSVLDAVAVAAAQGEDPLDLPGAVDETLDDVEVDALPPGRIRNLAVRQRIVHALLTVAHEREAGAARERRVRGILGALPGASGAGGSAPSGGARVLSFPGRWSRIAVAAALLVAAALVVSAMFGGAAPNAYLEAASKELGKDVDRRFELFADRIDTALVESIGVHDLWFHPLADGRLRFRLHLDGRRSGRHEVGSDGDVVWRRNLTTASDRESVPVVEANALFGRLGKLSSGHRGINDPDQFDIPRLLELIASGGGSGSREGETSVDADGHTVRVFFVERLEHRDFGLLSAVMVRVDTADSVIEALEFVRPDADGVMRYRFEYRGVDPRPTDFYRQPW